MLMLRQIISPCYVAYAVIFADDADAAITLAMMRCRCLVIARLLICAICHAAELHAMNAADAAATCSLRSLLRYIR